jgi:cation/acetate symporter
MFLGFVAVTLVVTWWAARRSTGSSAYFAAGTLIDGLAEWDCGCR